MARSAYKYNLDMNIIAGGKITNVDSNYIKYVVIEYLFEERYIPIIYISLSMTLEVGNMLLEHEEDGKVNLRIMKYNANSDLSLSKAYIEGTFSYILSTSNPTYIQDIAPNSEDVNTYMQLTIGLIDMNIIDRVKTSFSGVYGNIDMSTLLVKVLEGLNSVVKPLDYNPTFDTIIVPASNNRAETISYLFSQCAFYNTNYIFFVDFDKAYLVDTSGEAVSNKDDELNTVYIDIEGLSDDVSMFEGLEKNNDKYNINVQPANVNVVVNKITDKVANQVVCVADDGDIEVVNIEYDSTLITPKQLFTRGNSAGIYKNMADADRIMIEFSKRDLDGSIFTLSKKYILHNATDPETCDGVYSLVSKKEVIGNNSGEFNTNIMITLRRIDKVTNLGDINTAIPAYSSSLSAAARIKMELDGGEEEQEFIITKSNSGEEIKIKNPKYQPKPEYKSIEHYIPNYRKIKSDTDIYIKRVVKNLSDINIY